MSVALSSERLRAIVDTQSQIAATALDLDAVMHLVVRRARELLGAAAGVIEMVDGEEMVYHVVSGTADSSAGLRLRKDASLSGLCVTKDEVLYCADAETDERVDYEACLRVGAASMLCAPLRHEGRVVGVLKVYDGRRHAFGVADVETLSVLSALIAAQMAHADEYEDRAHASAHDSLTGLANRRSFDERLASEAARSRRHGSEVMLCLLDLDRFKAVNDTLGHAAGDEVLRAVSRHLLELRGEDAAYRIGGDEFALLLVQASRAGAEQVLERIADAVGADRECKGVGISWGLAPVTGGPAESLSRADAALYARKHAHHAAAPRETAPPPTAAT